LQNIINTMYTVSNTSSFGEFRSNLLFFLIQYFFGGEDESYLGLVPYILPIFIKPEMCTFYNIPTLIKSSWNGIYGNLGADYMESFQLGLSFSPVKRAEIASRLHEQFEPGLSLMYLYEVQETYEIRIPN
jgi:hypothetical protein